MSISVVVVVGFEESSYTAKEGDGSVEVCVVITRPTPDTELSLDVSLTYSTFFGSAGKEFVLCCSKYNVFECPVQLIFGVFEHSIYVYRKIMVCVWHRLQYI